MHTQADNAAHAQNCVLIVEGEARIGPISAQCASESIAYELPPNSQPHLLAIRATCIGQLFISPQCRPLPQKSAGLLAHSACALAVQTARSGGMTEVKAADAAFTWKAEPRWIEVKSTQTDLLVATLIWVDHARERYTHRLGSDNPMW